MKKPEHRGKQTEAVFETSANSVPGFPGTLVGNESACNAQTPFFKIYETPTLRGPSWAVGCWAFGRQGARCGSGKGTCGGCCFSIYPGWAPRLTLCHRNSLQHPSTKICLFCLFRFAIGSELAFHPVHSGVILITLVVNHRNRLYAKQKRTCQDGRVV